MTKSLKGSYRVKPHSPGFDWFTEKGKTTADNKKHAFSLSKPTYTMCLMLVPLERSYTGGVFCKKCRRIMLGMGFMTDGRTLKSGKLVDSNHPMNYWDESRLIEKWSTRKKRLAREKANGKP